MDFLMRNVKTDARKDVSAGRHQRRNQRRNQCLHQGQG
jgi:hypothetical protein